MVYCKNCGTEIEENAQYCSECGEKQESIKIIERVVVEKNPERREFDSTWYIAGILFPIVGIIGGIIFAIQNRKNAGLLILVSFILPFIMFLSIIYRAYFAY